MSSPWALCRLAVLLRTHHFSFCVSLFLRLRSLPIAKSVNR